MAHKAYIVHTQGGQSLHGMLLFYGAFPGTRVPPCTFKVILVSRKNDWSHYLIIIAPDLSFMNFCFFVPPQPQNVSSMRIGTFTVGPLLPKQTTVSGTYLPHHKHLIYLFIIY